VLPWQAHSGEFANFIVEPHIQVQLHYSKPLMTHLLCFRMQ